MLAEGDEGFAAAAVEEAGRANGRLDGGAGGRTRRSMVAVDVTIFVKGGYCEMDLCTVL